MKVEKLVRDRMPLVIARNEGDAPTFRVVVPRSPEYRTLLRKKLVEEVQEYLNAGSHEESIQELADIRSVLSALCENVHGRSVSSHLVYTQDRKDMDRGRFDQGVVMEFETPEKPPKYLLLLVENP